LTGYTGTRLDKWSLKAHIKLSVLRYQTAGEQSVCSGERTHLPFVAQPQASESRLPIYRISVVLSRQLDTYYITS